MTVIIRAATGSPTLWVQGATQPFFLLWHGMIPSISCDSRLLFEDRINDTYEVFRKTSNSNETKHTNIDSLGYLIPDLDVITPPGITFYNEITYIANDTRATFEIGREIAIIRRLGPPTSI